jgi:CRP-like cAMP-binding protein
MKTRRPAKSTKVTPVALQTDTHSVTAAQLEALPFFSNFSTAQLQSIRPAVALSYFEPDALLLAPDRPNEPFYVILSGRLAIEVAIDGRVFFTEEIGVGEAVGLPWLFAPDIARFTARALEPVTAICFGAELLRGDFGWEPSLNYELMIRTSQAMMKRMNAIVRAITAIREEVSPILF